MKPIAVDSGTRWRDTLYGTITHSLAHGRQFRGVNKPTMGVFGLVEETEIPLGNP